MNEKLTKICDMLSKSTAMQMELPVAIVALDELTPEQQTELCEEARAAYLAAKQTYEWACGITPEL